MALPTFADMKEQTAPVWKKFEKDVLWAGIFGSVSRARVRADSDVDFLVVLKKHLRTEEPLDLREGAYFVQSVTHLQLLGSKWAWGNIRIAALLTARTVYGKTGDIAHYRREALGFLDSGLERFKIIAESVSKINAIMAEVKTCEAFIHRSQRDVRQAFFTELEVILRQLDLPSGHPTITMLLPDVGMSADKLCTLIEHDQPDVNDETAPFWNALWVGFQPGQQYIQAFDRFCSYGPPEIRHILATKTLVEALDSGAVVTEDMYIGVR
ncbi:hypothetical protein C0991_002303 [Blastosporella zonata]|nr:hypothetical protein C0991_002303 [Blastosporella zonata]